VHKSVKEAFKALIVGFGKRIKMKRKESLNTRIRLRLIIHCLKIMIRWAHLERANGLKD